MIAGARFYSRILGNDGTNTWTPTCTAGNGNGGVWKWDTDQNDTGNRVDWGHDYTMWTYRPEPKPKMQPILPDYWPDVVLTKLSYAHNEPALQRNPGGQFRGLP